MEVEEQGAGGGIAGSGESAKVSDAVYGSEAVRGVSGAGEGGGRSDEERKLWATVSANPSDFKSWTALLQLTEQNVGVRRGREIQGADFVRDFLLSPPEYSGCGSRDLLSVPGALPVLLWLLEEVLGAGAPTQRRGGSPTGAGRGRGIRATQHRPLAPLCLVCHLVLQGLPPGRAANPEVWLAPQIPPLSLFREHPYLLASQYTHTHTLPLPCGHECFS